MNFYKHLRTKQLRDRSRSACLSPNSISDEQAEIVRQKILGIYRAPLSTISPHTEDELQSSRNAVDL